MSRSVSASVGASVSQERREDQIMLSLFSCTLLSLDSGPISFPSELRGAGTEQGLRPCSGDGTNP